MSQKAAASPRPPAPLIQFAGEKPPAPDWFVQALDTPCERGSVDVEGANVVWKAWGERGQPGLVLVHGGVAHKDWWDSIGPFLAPTRRVVALDLSGMGDSDHRERYVMETYACEVIAAGQAGGAFDAGKPFIVGHSFGGFVSLALGMEFGEQVRGVGVLDSPVRPPEEQRRSSPPSRGGTVYPTFRAAMERFRLLPEQPCANAFLLDHIARKSLKQARRPDGTDGWTWKFDPRLWDKLDYNRPPPAQLVGALKTRVALFRGAQSRLVTDEIWSYMRDTFGPDTTMVSIPDAQHHLILDQPIAVAAALEVLTGPGWGV
ncbi:alpha/beta hydrolase [Maricaulis sp.]|jgi:pimeloyl-ACP methyl ester carboxylesterase|uniref:alpha/beta fold hydrolase n=1 Tax=Maricaulis sp. TaxID=1486257 RepID=UPI002618B0AD|nr:alpha/beta hydrolase [Maricaulis sp.]